MKKNIKLFICFYTAFLILGVACDDNCGPFEDKFSVTSINWTTPQTDSTPISFDNFTININPIGTYFYSHNSTSLDLMNKTYACSPIPADTDDQLLNIEIFTDQDYNSNYLQGDNLADLFDIHAQYSRAGIIENLNLNDFLSVNRNFPDEMILQLKNSPSNSGSFTFTVKLYLDGAELDYYEFTTEAINIQI